MKKKLIYQLLIILLPLFSFGQEITGVWKGEFYVDSTKKTCDFQLTISEDKGKYTGYSRISFEEDGIRQVVFRDHKINIKDNIVTIEDDNQLSRASSIAQPKEVKKVMILTLNIVDSTMSLEGTWSTNKTKRYLTATGTAKMEKKKDFRSTEIFKKLDSLSLTNKLSFNKPEPVVAEIPKEEPVAKLDKIMQPDFTKPDIPTNKKTTALNVSKPNPLIRPKESPVAAREPGPPIVIAVKKPTSPPVVKPKEPAAIVKNDKPVITKTAPVVVSNIPKPVQPEIKPVEKKVNILPDQKNAAVDAANRSISSMQSLYYRSDSLQLTLYDNGEIDGDTVSVLLNGKVIIAKKGLDVKPNNYTIYFNRDTPDSQMLVMYAENLGSIPPNTGLLVVHDGAAVYEVRFSADLKSNAAIILRRRRDE